MILPRILILGAGRRVTIDVLPALVHLGYKENDLLILRDSDAQLIQFPQFQCIKINSDKVEGFNPKFIISCLPCDVSESVISKVLQKCSPDCLIVDTPVSRNAKFLEGVKLPYGVYVLEDNHLVYFSRQIREYGEIFRAIMLRNAFYDYHGIAFLRSTLGELSRFRIKIRLRRFLLLLFFAGNTLIFWVGPRDYSKGEIYVSRRDLSFWKFSRLKIDQSVLSDFELAYLRSNYGPLGSKRIIEDNPIRHMLFWKQVGLAQALRALLIENQNSFITIQDSIENEKFFIDL